MKKIALATVLVFAVFVGLSSCKSHEKCPAYSKANTTTVSAKKSV